MKHCFVADLQKPQALSGCLMESGLLTAFNNKFNAVFSNAALHWCNQSPKGVIESAAMVLEKNGRFVVEMGGSLNCIGELNALDCLCDVLNPAHTCTGMITAIHAVLRKRGYDPRPVHPFYFPTVQEYKMVRRISQL